jgi:hypothetical protein
MVKEGWGLLGSAYVTSVPWLNTTDPQGRSTERNGRDGAIRAERYCHPRRARGFGTGGFRQDVVDNMESHPMGGHQCKLILQNRSSKLTDRWSEQ